MKSGARTTTTLAPSGASGTVKAPSAPVRASPRYRVSPSTTTSLDATKTRAPPTGLPASSTTRPDIGCAAGSRMSNRGFSSAESKGPEKRGVLSGRVVQEHLVVGAVGHPLHLRTGDRLSGSIQDPPGDRSCARLRGKKKQQRRGERAPTESRRVLHGFLPGRLSTTDYGLLLPKVTMHAWPNPRKLLAGDLSVPQAP